MMVVFIVCSLGILGFFHREKKKGEESSAARRYWLNAGMIFGELSENPSMTAAKWRMVAEVFDQADQRFAKIHPQVKDFVRYGALARQIADDMLGDIVGVS